MRWLTATFAAGLLVLGVCVLWHVLATFRGGGVRSDETDVLVVVGGSAVLAGLLVLAMMAVTT